MSSNRAIQHLDRALRESKFKFGDYIGKGFDIWKQEAGLFIAFGFLYMVIGFIIGLIPILGSVVTNLILTPCITVGGYYFSNRITKRRAEFGDFFAGFNKIGPLVLVTLIIWIISMILLAPFFAVVGMEIFNVFTSQEPMEMLEFAESFQGWYLLLLLPVLFIYFLFSFALPLVWFFDLSPIDSIKYSSKYVARHYLLFLLFFIVTILIAVSGIILIFIGIIITFTFIYPMFYAAFRDLTQLDAYENPDEDQAVVDLLVS